jgi:hypothetical protein
MQTYLVVRRSAWTSLEQQREAEARSSFEAARMEEEITSVRSYPLEENDRTIGSVCIYEASSPEAVRRHAAAAALPVDEIVKVAEPAPAPADGAESTTTEREGRSR